MRSSDTGSQVEEHEAFWPLWWKHKSKQRAEWLFCYRVLMLHAWHVYQVALLCVLYTVAHVNTFPGFTVGCNGLAGGIFFKIAAYCNIIMNELINYQVSQSGNCIISYNCPDNDVHKARQGLIVCSYCICVLDILNVGVRDLFLHVCPCVTLHCCVRFVVHIISISILLTWSLSSQSGLSVLSAGVVSSLWDSSKWRGAPHSTTAAFISLSLSSFLFFPAQHRTNTNTHPQTHKHTRIMSASLYLLQRQRMLMLKKRNTDYCQLGLMMICEKVTKCDCVTSWLIK